MIITHDNAAAERRIKAYTRFLMDAYGTDLEGLADIAGVSAEELRRYQAATFDNISTNVLVKLANLTCIRCGWLFAESEVAE